jgi:hypothetical protein
MIVSTRGVLRSTTMLSGLLGWAFLSVSSGWTADLMPTKAPTLTSSLDPAVDAFNGKVDGYVGNISGKELFGGQGSLTFPVQSQFGAQLDGNVGSLASSGFAAVAGHWFWRNPNQALIGVYASQTYWDAFGGVYVTQVAGEGEYYFGKFTVQGIAGVEFGNSVSTTSVIPPGGGGSPGLVTNSSFGIGTRFFDEVNLKYYFDNNFDGYIGHRYLGGQNALALGGEAAVPLGAGLMGSAFIEARIGEDDFHGVWGGLKLYFGQGDKPLIARHRREDPPEWTTDTLFSILNNSNGAQNTSTPFCTPPRTLHNGNCEAPSSIK